jgi:nucleoid DNA-binding protein
MVTRDRSTRSRFFAGFPAVSRVRRAAAQGPYGSPRDHARRGRERIHPRRSHDMAKKTTAPTKSEILAQISKDTDLSKRQVAAVFESLDGVIRKSLKSVGLFTMPGLLKMKVVKRPATKAREGVNPFTGEKMTFKAKPASKKVRVMPLKSLKGMVN